ncbi:MAG: mycofactocin system FadH/OYE family oxidoreductase 2 [Acidimicrobiia bacterium]|nr:mycofactocin system FadH/OYE family oxidoreductase 2 [Acidimicrobiia bacterium]
MSATGRYRHLFTPIKLGSIAVPNRIVFSAHLTNYATQDGKPSDQHVAYYEARAAGGAGLIITEEHSVHPTDWPYEKMIHAFHPDVVEGYRRITEAVHANGTPILAQINHNGGQASSMYTRLPVWAPSAVPDPLFREMPKAVEQHEIDEIVESYAVVAARCIEGGFDGVELQCSHSSIVRGFLSPATNHRSDGYGGSLDNRARLLHEIVAAVRARMGPEPVLGVRLCGDELIEGGTTIDDAVELAVQIEDRGGVDYINTSIGVATASLFMIEASMHIPPEYALFIPSAIRDEVSLPVVGVGRFKDPLQADRALAEGHADLIGVVRGQIADPDFAAKARAGHAEHIRLCLSCNQECVGRMGLNRWLGCIENPYTGRESELARSTDAMSPQPAAGAARSGEAEPDTVVIGGGPAGLQASITSAQRGHRVTLLEASSHLGGQVKLAATVPNRAELGDLVRNLGAEARRIGVDVRLETRGTVDLIEMLAPDAVIVATGSVPTRPWWAPPADAGGERIVDVVDVLEGTAEPSGSVVVIDDVGFHQATSVAELLADRGCAVEVITKAMVVGQDLGVTLDMETWWYRASAKGIVQTTDRVPMGYDNGRLTLLHHPTGTDDERQPDWLVLASHQRPRDELYFGLKEAAGTTGTRWLLRRIGDCVAPRRAHAAIIDGRRAADELDAELRARGVPTAARAR